MKYLLARSLYNVSLKTTKEITLSGLSVCAPETSLRIITKDNTL
jgi:hypothetical protein